MAQSSEVEGLAAEQFVVEGTTVEYLGDWLKFVLTTARDHGRFPGKVDIVCFPPNRHQPEVRYWVHVAIPWRDQGEDYLGCLVAIMLQIAPDAVYLELMTADQALQPWWEQLVTDLKQTFKVRRKGGVRGNKGDTLSRVADAKALMKQNIPKTEACKRAGIDTRTFDKYAELDDFPLDY